MSVKNFARGLPAAGGWCKMCSFLFGCSRQSLKISKYVKIVKIAKIVKIVKEVLHALPCPLLTSGPRHMQSENADLRAVGNDIPGPARSLAHSLTRYLFNSFLFSNRMVAANGVYPFSCAGPCQPATDLKKLSSFLLCRADPDAVRPHKARSSSR
jgi:hypothetical protein